MSHGVDHGGYSYQPLPHVPAHCAIAARTAQDGVRRKIAELEDELRKLPAGDQERAPLRQQLAELLRKDNLLLETIKGCPAKATIQKGPKCLLAEFLATAADERMCMGISWSPCACTCAQGLSKLIGKVSSSCMHCSNSTGCTHDDEKVQDTCNGCVQQHRLWGAPPVNVCCMNGGMPRPSIEMHFCP
jgi:hypothetical protein